jgi:AraC-like DNA-binding protein
VQPAPTPSKFLAAPMGTYFARSSYAVFCASPQLRGHACWGVPPLDELREMIELFQLACTNEDAPHRWLVDLRHLHFIDPAAFGLFVEFIHRARAKLTATMHRQAQLRPPGMLGAVISGFSAIARLPYEERVFEEPADALAWLGVELDDGMSALRSIDEVRESALGGRAAVARVRHLLEEHPRASLVVVARQLAHSPRQLQRELGRAGTTFRDEVRRSQLLRAERLLLHTELPVSQVALEAGFATAQHFAASFREAKGATPSAWRRRERPAKPT